MGVIIPWLVLGVALLMIFNFIGLGRSYLGMYLGNSICVLPYVVLLVYPALCELNDNLEFAARAMGASPLRAFFTVVLPGIFPAVAAGGLMAFMVCFNNFVIQYYLAPFACVPCPWRSTTWSVWAISRTSTPWPPLWCWSPRRWSIW